MVLSSLALGISLVFSAVKFFEWVLHSDPRSILRVGRWLLLTVAAASVPGLVMLLVYEQWTAAMLLGSFLITAPALFAWRTILPRARVGPLRAPGAPTSSAPEGGFEHDSGPSVPDPDLVREAATVLERYLIHTGAITGGSRDTPAHTRPRTDDGHAQAPMDAGEALAVLGLDADASAAAIRDAHRNLMQRVHPDRGGTNYLAAKINRAKDVLLAEARGMPPAPARKAARASPRRAASKDAKA